MATASSSDPLAVADWDHGSETKSDRYLAARLAAAGADFKGVAVATFALGTGVVALAWLGAGVLAEHWLVPGGLPAAARWLWFAAGATALVAGLVRWVVPLVRCRVNLLYAARVIEHEHPDLHNDIVNAVLVKARPGAAAPIVARSLEQRAAKRLSAVPADGVADRAVPLRLTIALAALVAALCVYQVLAPKSLVVSAARLLAPWWGIAAPARVSIAPPLLAWRMPPDASGAERPQQPLEAVDGTVTLVRGRQLVVETEVRGLRSGERPEVVVTPRRDDGPDASPPWTVPLAPTAQPGRLQAVLPDAARGLEHGVEFVVAAGDARSGRLRVAVVDAPSLLVREVRYDYPPYTRRPPETVAWQGDLRAPEFTRVTITAEGNRPLETAWIDPGCAGRESEKKRMRIGQHDLARAIVDFPLRMNADRSAAEFVSYRLGFQPRASSSASREPPVTEKLEYRVEVIADVAPEVVVDAPEDAIRVPPSAPVSIRVRALDPDYGLARVGIETRVRGGAERPPAWMLERPQAEPFAGAVEIVPERLGAAAGGALEYRAVAHDTRPEKANVSYSAWRSLQIDAAAPPQPLDRQPPPGDGGDAPGGHGDDPGSGQRAGDARRPDQRPEGGDAAREPQGGGGEESAARGQGRDMEQPRADGPDAAEPRRDNGGRREDGERRENEGQSGGQQQGQPGQGGAGKQDGGVGKQAGGAGKQDGGAGKQGGGAGKQDGRAGKENDGAGKQDGGAGKQGGGAGKQDGGGGKENDGAGTRSDAGKQDGGAGKQKGGDGAQQDGAGQRDGGDSEQNGGAGKQDGGAAKQDGGRSPPRNAVAADGTNDGEAMERILENRRRRDAEQRGGNPATGPGHPKPGEQPGKEGRAPDKPPAPAKDGETGGTPREAAGAAKQPPACADANGKPCGKPQCSSCNGGGQSGGSPGGGAGQGQSGSPQPGQGQPGEGQSGQGQGQQGQGSQAQGQQGQGQTGQGQQGQGQQGQGQQNQGQQNQGQQNQGQQNQGQQNQGQQNQGEGRDGQAARQGQGEQGQGEKGRGQQGQGQQAHGQGQPQQGGQPAGELPEGAPPSGSTVGAGGRVGGDRGGQRGNADGDAARRDVEWTEQDTAHARNAADLAVEHLRDSVNAGRTEVLDELGWTPEQAREFIERWQAMRRLAGSEDRRDRGEFERAVRSLGLRPDGVRSTRGLPADAKGGQAEGRRSRPPAAYREQVEAYLRGTGGG